MDKLLKPADAAARLGISIAQLTRLTVDGELPYINIGRGSVRPARRYDPADLDAFVASRKVVEVKAGVSPRTGTVPSVGSYEIIDFVGLQAERSRGRR